MLTYDRPGEQTEVSLLAVGRFTQYFDVSTDDKDLNLTASLTHNFTTRLSFYASVYGAYQTEPNFQSNIGPTNVRAPHFDTTDIFSLTYHWVPRLSSVTSYTFERVKYESSSLSTSAVAGAQDRFQNTLAESLQFSLTRRTSLTGEYRFEVIDYDTAPSDATIHFALAGVDHHLTEHLSIKLLGGPSFRFFKNDGNTINPYAQLKVSYEGSNHSLSWITTYGVEQPSRDPRGGGHDAPNRTEPGVPSNFADQFERRNVLLSRGKPSGDNGASCKHFDRLAGCLVFQSRPEIYNQ